MLHLLIAVKLHTLLCAKFVWDARRPLCFETDKRQQWHVLAAETKQPCAQISLEAAKAFLFYGALQTALKVTGDNRE